MKIGFWLFACYLVVGAASAAQVHWFSHLDHFNFDSDAKPMDASFRFELGVFRDGFVPTPENRSEWSAYWAPAQRVQYNAAHGWYSGYLTVKDNEAPFVAGAEAWVWGFSGDAGAGDWVLFRSSSWKWPQANPREPVARQWNAKQSNRTLIGNVASASVRLLEAEAVENMTPPLTTFGQWSAEPGRSTKEAGDLVVFATGPNRAPVRIERSVGVKGSPTMEIRLARLADRQLSVAAIEVSKDLVHWEPYPRYARLKWASPTEIAFELKLESEEETQLFFRAKYER